MATVTLKGNPCSTIGELPSVGQKAPNFSLKTVDLNETTLEDYKGSTLILNIYPSVDTGTCAASTRKFNELASQLENTKIICVSKDLPFAQKRFCGAEGIENVVMASDFATGNFGTNYGVTLVDGPLQALHARAIVVINPEGEVTYTQLIPEIVDEPNYDAALAAI